MEIANGTRISLVCVAMEIANIVQILRIIQKFVIAMRIWRIGKMSEKEIVKKVIEQADTIAKAICKGKDVEIRKSASGMSVAEVSKRVVAK